MKNTMTIRLQRLDQTEDQRSSFNGREYVCYGITVKNASEEAAGIIVNMIAREVNRMIETDGEYCEEGFSLWNCPSYDHRLNGVTEYADGGSLYVEYGFIGEQRREFERFWKMAKKAVLDQIKR